MKDKIEFFLESLTSMHEKACEDVDRFLKMQLSPNPESFKEGVSVERAENAISSVKLIESSLPTEYHPAWLGQTLKLLRSYTANSYSSTGLNAVLELATDAYPKMLDHTWEFDNSNELGFDFDLIFEEARAANLIPELFEKIISCLQEIVESGKIDSIRVIGELRSIISTLRNAKGGSYLATRLSWEFLVRWTKNTGWEFFSEVPMLGALIRGLRQAMQETDDALGQMHENMHDRMEASLEADLPQLGYEALELPPPSNLDKDN